MAEVTKYQKTALEDFYPFLNSSDEFVLEIGSDLQCAVVSDISRHVHGDVVGVNPHPQFGVNQAPGERVHAVQATGHKMPFLDGAFDAIFSVATLEHVADVAAFISECDRLLKPGGRFYTQFGPIWSCSVGHHLCADIPGKSARFHTPGQNPLVDYSHLLLDEEAMRKFLHEGPCDDRLVQPIIEWVYHSAGINRLFFEDYEKFFAEGALKLKKFRAWGPSQGPDAKVLEQLQAKHGRNRNYHHSMIEVSCLKPGRPEKGRAKKMTETSITGPGTESGPAGRLLEILACPLTGSPLEYDSDKDMLISEDAGVGYEIRDGVPVLLGHKAVQLKS